MILGPPTILIISIAIILILFILMGKQREHFASTAGAKFRMSGRKNKCACALRCDQIYSHCLKRPGSYSSSYCDMRRDLCRRSCFYSDYGA